jgi:mono/diheme cytochrome c family protein
VTNGKEGPLGSMPSFAGQLTSDQIQQVASYLAVATGGAH